MAGGGAGDLGGWWGEGEAERGYCQNEKGDVLHGCFVIVTSDEIERRDH